MMNLDIRQMQYIVKLAEVGNFTGAARDLYISQPSLSTLVSRVEAELGVQIFDRGTSPMTLTSAGAVYVEGLRQICGQTEALDEQMRAIINDKKGELNVGFPMERAAALLPYIMPAYRRMYPNIRVKVESVSTREMLYAIADKRIAMGIIPSTEAITGMRSDEICREELFLADGGGFIQKEHLVPGTSDCVDITKLDGMPLIALRKTHAIRLFIQELFKNNGVSPKLVMEVPFNSVAYRLACVGMGTAVIPALTINMIRGLGDAKIYRLSSSGTYWSVLAISDKNAYMSDIEKDFIQCMKDSLRDKLDHAARLRAEGGIKP